MRKLTLGSFFRNSVVFGVVHVFIIMALAANIFQYYKMWEEKVKIQTSQAELDQLKLRVSDFYTESNYLSSDIFMEKQSRELNYQKEGEYVVDTISIESSEDGVSVNYVPEGAEQSKTNFQKWKDCFFGAEKQKCLK